LTPAKSESKERDWGAKP